MHTFECYKCNKYLGEMNKGKLHNKSIILCTECYNSINDKRNDSAKIDMPDFLQDLFKKKY